MKNASAVVMKIIWRKPRLVANIKMARIIILLRFPTLSSMYLKYCIDHGVTTFSWPFLKLLQPWTCGECWIPNKSTDDKCVACGNPKQSNGKSIKLTDISVQSSSLINAFGDRTFKPLPSSGGIPFFIFLSTGRIINILLNLKSNEVSDNYAE